MKYRKKPVVVDAIHYRGKQDDSLLKSFVDGRYLYRDGKTYKWLIVTPEGDHQVSDGDYIIKGVKGEFYPCKPDIFEMTYEPAENGCFQNGKDHVVLTADEAKALLRRIPEFKENGDWQLPIETLKQRIEQMEATNTQDELIRIKCEIAQLKAEQELDNWLKQQFLKRMEDKDE